jgi:hypothetical protein
MLICLLLTKLSNENIYVDFSTFVRYFMPWTDLCGLQAWKYSASMYLNTKTCCFTHY